MTKLKALACPVVAIFSAENGIQEPNSNWNGNCDCAVAISVKDCL